jgi:hypothetical protein
MSETVDPEQLGENRQLVLGVALASGAVGLVPLPVLPDLAISSLRAVLVKQLAQRRQVDLSLANALAAVEGEGAALGRLAATTATVAGRRSWRSLARALLVLLRFEDMGRSFLLGTYFDYYLLRYHRGEALSRQQSLLFYDVSRAALSGAHVDVISALFRRTVSDMLRAGVYLPRTLLEMAVTAVRGGQEAVEQVQQTTASGVVGAVTGLLEREIQALGQDTLAAIYRGFDEGWIEAGGEGQVTEGPR